jgi:formylglycine-generating enzyme required for sulfatase activity
MTAAGTILNNRYQILGLLSGQGGMGLVYQATDLNLRDTVVIKQSRFNDEAFMRQKFPDLKGAAMRSQAEYLRKAFEREARLLRGLRHNALPRVLDYFDLEGQQSLVMEFIPGKDLREMLTERLQNDQGPFPLHLVLDWADQLLDALNYLHTHFDTPIIHRDIKPQNLKLMPNGQIILLDFGLAKGASPGMSVVESIWGGTPEYAPLEQVDEDENEEQKSDQRSDLYSLGLTLHHLLSGRKPPRTISRLKAEAQVKPDPLRPLSEIAPHIPETVSAVLQRAAAIFAKDRLATAAEMRQLLRRAAASLTQAIDAPQPKHESETIVRPGRKIVISLGRDDEWAKPEVEAEAEAPRIVAHPNPAHPKPHRIVASPDPLPFNFIENLNGVKLEMIYIPGGEFTMGSNFLDESPRRRVKLSPFFIGKYQITQAQWKAVMGINPSHFKGDALPAENALWDDVMKFCEVVSKRSGKTYRLPTEAEWEYACRAGSDTNYCFGDDEESLGDYAWHSENSGAQTHPVGRKKPNAWGLYDMHGNVWECCEDVWHKGYNGAPTDGSARLSGGNPSIRVLRGGSYSSPGGCSRSTYRSFTVVRFYLRTAGFRVVVSALTGLHKSV